MIHVVAVITAKPGRREQILAEFREIIPTVRAEEGCIEYGPAIDLEDGGAIQTEIGSDTFMVIEKWTSRDTLAARLDAAGYLTAGNAGKVKELIDSRVIHVLRSAEQG